MVEDFALEFDEGDFAVGPPNGEGAAGDGEFLEELLLGEENFIG